MAKAAPDATLDKMADYISTSTAMVACSAEPTTYTEAFTTYALADVVMAGGDFTKANGDSSGRKVTMAQKTGVTVDASGTATHVALVITGSSTLVYVTTCTSQALTAANTMTFNAWKIEVADPT